MVIVIPTTGGHEEHPAARVFRVDGAGNLFVGLAEYQENSLTDVQAVYAAGSWKRALAGADAEAFARAGKG